MKEERMRKKGRKKEDRLIQRKEGRTERSEGISATEERNE